MFNETYFIIHSILISLFVIAALKIGKETLITLLCIQAILSNIFVTKQILLLGLCATCGDVFSVGSSLSLNLIQEYYGKTIAQKTIWVSFFCLIFYLTMTQMHLIYVPSEFDVTQNAFATLLGAAPRIVLVSLISYLISQQIDTNLYAYFRHKFAGKFFILRNYGSLLISQLADTLFFTIFALYGIVENLGQIFIVSYAIKIFAILISTPIVAYLKQHIKTPDYN